MPSSESSNNRSVGIEAGMETLTAVLLDAGKIVDTRTAPVDPAGSALEQLGAFATEVVAGSGKPDRLGIAIPGLIHRETRRITFSARVPDYSDLDLSGTVQAQTGLVPAIENDANAAGYAEFLLGAGRGSSSMFYATIGDGVGGAFIFDGKLWHGAAGYAGELGYVAINSEGLHLEDLASATNIVRRTRERFNQDSTSSLGRLPEEKIGLSEIIRAAGEGDEFARLMLERTGLYVGTAIANVINLLNVETIVIGGEITAAKGIVVEAITARAKELSFVKAFERTRIVSGELGEKAPAIGAALLAAQD